MVKNFSFAQKPPARAAFFCAGEGSWTQAKANKLVFHHHAGVGFLCFLLWAVWAPYGCKCFHVQPSPSNASQWLSKKTSAPSCKTHSLWRLLCPLPPLCSSFGCFSSWLLQGGGLWGFSSSPIPTKQLRTRLRDAAAVESASTADLTAAVRQSGLCALLRDAGQLRGLCSSAREVKDAVNKGSWWCFCPWKEC